jgi:hypothetical protein
MPTPKYGGSMKSNVSDLLEVVLGVYRDACTLCVADVFDVRDLLTISSRVESEGPGFLTLALPRFCEDFERSLAEEHVDSSSFLGFKKLRRGEAIPAFLQGMLSLLFDRKTGRYEQNSNRVVSSSIVECVRQICLTFKKLELPCTDNKVLGAVSNFVQTELDLSTYSPDPEDLALFCATSSVLWDNILFDLRLTDCTPRHGPGATADGQSGNGKYRWQYWHERLEPYFPLIDSAFSFSAFGSEELKMVTVLPSESEVPVKVTPVPKTLKGPRIIAVEPCCMQYAQQGVRDLLYGVLERSRITAGHVNFRDQSVNQRLALIASENGQYSTIDLSEASDRVPRDLALSMFDSNPDLRDAIDACRSTHAKLPDGTIIGPLKKFASMGSALCFPVESMYFYTICVAALLKSMALPINHRNAFKASRDVYVYGDDIVVPSKHATIVLDYLQKYNCKVNMSKTFLSGSFRESCGMDAFAGRKVTPTYLRQMRPENKQQADRVISWVKTANLFYQRGYWITSSILFNKVERLMGILPYLSEDSAGLGRTTYLGEKSISKWNSRLQRLEIKAWTPEPVHRTDELVGYAALQKSLSKLQGLSDLDLSRDASHLERTAQYGAVTLKRRWVPAS